MTADSNIVLVTIDSLRADYCSFMGHQESTTPTLDALASEGTAFVTATAPGPSTPESMPAVFTGRYPIDTIDPTNIRQARTRIRRHMTARETIPERLSRRGYATAGFTPNPYTSRYFGFDAGFDHFEDFTGVGVRSAGDSLLQRLSPSSDVVQAARMLLNLLQREEVFKPWEAYVDDVAAWIETADRPYFVWVHLMDPHVPYMAPGGYRQLGWWTTVRANVAFWRGDNEAGLDPTVLETLQTAYTDTVRYTDAFLERLHAMTDADTSLVIHADHGEAFGEHGTYGHEPYLYEENIHVPLVVSGVPASTIDHPMSLRALPTLVTQLADGDWEPATSGVPFAVSRTARHDRVALRGHRLKYIRSAAGQELYDLAHGEHGLLDEATVQAICQNSLDWFDANDQEARAVRDAAERLAEANT